MNLGPFRQGIGIMRLIRILRYSRCGGMVRPLAMRTMKMPREINQLTAYLLRGQREKCPHRVRFYILERPCQAHESALKYIACLSPTLDGGVRSQHVPGQLFKPAPRMTQQFVQGRALAIL